MPKLDSDKTKLGEDHVAFFGRHATAFALNHGARKAHRGRRPAHCRARAGSAYEPLQVGYRQDALRSIHTEALRPSLGSEESPRAFRQRVPAVKARAPRCGRTTTAFGLEFACPRVLATVRQLCASGPYGVLEQNGAYSGGTLHPRCCHLRLQRAAVWAPCRHVAPLGADYGSGWALATGACISLGAHRSRRPVLPHGGARASEPPCSADEPLQVGYRQDALRSIHTEALRPSSSSEESPRAFRQRVPTVKARAPRCGRTTTALGLEFACLRVLATVRQLCASGPYGVLEQNGAYSGGTLHPRCCDLRLQRAAVWTPCRHVTAPLGADDVSRAGRCSLGAHRSRRPVCPHGRAGASAPPCSADEPLQVGYRQDALRSIHTEALRPSSSSEESPRAFRQRVPAVKARAPRCGRTTTAFGLEFACLQVLATVRQLCASGPYGVLEQNGAYSGGTLHPRCYDMRLQ